MAFVCFSCHAYSSRSVLLPSGQCVRGSPVLIGGSHAWPLDPIMTWSGYWAYDISCLRRSKRGPALMRRRCTWLPSSCTRPQRCVCVGMCGGVACELRCPVVSLWRGRNASILPTPPLPFLPTGAACARHDPALLSFPLPPLPLRSVPAVWRRGCSAASPTIRPP